MSKQTGYRELCEEIASAAIKCGRNPKEISLIAVTKKVDWETAQDLYRQGQRDFGENRAGEALAKQQEAPKDCQWHFIGHLQGNKIRKVIGKFSLIHSIDSLELAEKLSQISESVGIITPILLQANTSGELSKQGLSPKEWKACFKSILNLKGVAVKGLMTMAPLGDDEDAIRMCFRRLKDLRDELNAMTNGCAALHHLSMGMSRDFKVAIEEGATLIRIGTALFK